MLLALLLAATALPATSNANEGPSSIVDVIDAFAPKPVEPLDLQSGDGSLTVVDSALDRLAAARSIAPLPQNVFGESVDPMGRNLRFFQTDVLLRGTGPDIAISRSLDVNASRSTWWQREREFADWKLELPRMSTKTPHPGLQTPWSVSGSDAAKRCTSFGLARDVTINSYNFPASEWWQGVQLTIPGQGSQDVLRRTPQNTLTPSLLLDGKTPTFPLVTTAHWVISCLPATSNGMPGEGFLAVSPNGDKYWFDRLVTGGWDAFQMPFQIGFSIERHDAIMLPSRIEDRHGNALVLTYDAARLTGIQASDGRAVSLAWESVNGISFITSVTEQPGDPKARTWKYTYLTPSSRTLHMVTLPDDSKWTFNFSLLTNYCTSWTDEPSGPACSTNPLNLGTNLGTAISPSGVTGAFKIAGGLGYRHLTTPLPSADCLHENDPWSAEFVEVYTMWRRYTGPGIDQLWSYDPCPWGACPSFANMGLDEGSGLFMETDPAGKTTVTAVDYTWCGPHQGEVTKTFIDPVFNQDGFVSAARIIDTTKAAPATGPFPSRIGTVPQTYANRAQLEYLRPLQQRDIVQDGVTFTWKAETFDVYGQPLRVKHTATPGASRTDITAYDNNASKWLLGRIASVTDQSTGAVPFAQTFDADSGDVLTQSRFGKLEQTLTYHANGLVQTLSDGAGNATALSNYKRGIPQTIAYVDGTSSTAVIDNLGQVTSTTDALGYTTTYGYDLAGRLDQIAYPDGDTTPWNKETFVFQRRPEDDYDLPPGHWRHTTSNGNYRKVVYYDARWNPVLTREYDNADPDGSDRFTARRFDHAGRETFVSYPTGSATTWNSITAGVRTHYDELGRPTRHEQDSELGELVTTTDYLAPFHTRTTNPRGFATTTTYQVFDQPTYDAPLVITAPEGQTTTVERDVFGKPKMLTRSGVWSGNALSVSRQVVYDSHQRPCKIIEPETGASVLAYDAAGNIAWQATGQSFASTTDCNQASVPASAKSQHSYDTRNRLLGIDHPIGTDDLTYSYFADGALKTAATPASTWTYTYNKRRLLESESLAFDGKNVLIDWAYNAQGHIASQLYPSGLNLGFNPTVFGQPRQTGTYATGATYLPGGGLDGFTYGNGVVRDVTPNTRLLPDRIRDTKNATVLLDHSFGYDPNGNLIARIDGVGAGLESSDLTYDDLDRLISAVVPNKFGVESFEYDPLDNVRRAMIGGIDLHYGIDAKNRLSDIAVGGDTLHTYTWNTRGALATRGRPGEPNPQGVFRDGFETGGDMLPPTVQTFVFDAANRLKRIEGLERYDYDAHGHRLRTLRDTGTMRNEIRDRSGRLLSVEDSRDNQRIDYIALGGALVAKRTRPLNGNTATTTYLHSDARGTPSVESNAAGAMLLRTRLTPYGAPYDGVWRDGPGFTGHVADASSQLVYMQQRYMDPLALRFISVDPVGASATSYNRYWYANNNPYRFTDPDGRWACSGSTSDCGKFESGLGRVAEAANSTRLTQGERGVLRGIVAFYGEKGDATVSVSFADLGGPGGNARTRDDGGQHVTMDLGAASRKSADRTLNVIARVIAHEGQHGIDDRQRGGPVATRKERKVDEINGYTAQAYYQKAASFSDSSADGWTMWGGLSESNIDRQAEGSVTVSCMTSNEGSCK